MVSNFIHHTSCDNCGSSDANGVFDDGHTFCWSCGWVVKPQSQTLDDVERHLKKKEVSTYTTSLPDDYTLKLPLEPYSWLKKYYISNEEIEKNNLGWSQSRQMLIFPYYEREDKENDREKDGKDKEGQTEEDPIFWQGRYFPLRKPKTFSCGNINDNLIINRYGGVLNSPLSSVCCVVEDPVSAIKVSRKVDTLCLFGSHLSLQKAIRISKFYSHLILWLDQDKTKEMLKFYENYKYLFKKISIFSTELDPKEQDIKKIEELLNEL